MLEEEEAETEEEGVWCGGNGRTGRILGFSMMVKETTFFEESSEDEQGGDDEDESDDEDEDL